jgi:hypothetical protein
MARPGRQERNRAARSFRQLKRFHHVIHSNKVFGTHRRFANEEANASSPSPERAILTRRHWRAIRSISNGRPELVGDRTFPKSTARNGSISSSHERRDKWSFSIVFWRSRMRAPGNDVQDWNHFGHARPVEARGGTTPGGRRSHRSRRRHRAPRDRRRASPDRACLRHPGKCRQRRVGARIPGSAIN